MTRVDKVPRSLLSAHSAMRGHFDTCLGLLLSTSREDPFSRWLGDWETRRKYFSYLLSCGFAWGSVTVAQPRAGICVAQPLRSGWHIGSWSYKVAWQKLRLRLALSSAKGEAFQTTRRALRKHAAKNEGSRNEPSQETLQETSEGTSEEASQGTFIWNLSVRRSFSGRRVSRVLLDRLLKWHVEEDGPLYFQTARGALMRLIDRMGGTQIARVQLPQEGPLLRIGRISVSDLKASNFLSRRLRPGP